VRERDAEALRALEANKLLSDAEMALKRLRDKTDDKQAIDALEQALQRLKERDKPKRPGSVGPGELYGR